MNRNILSDYIDACELIRETERDIARMEQKQSTVTQDSVRGSNPEFPYEEKRFVIRGVEFDPEDDQRQKKMRRLLEERKTRAEQIRVEVEQWLNTVPSRMQRIIRYRVFEGMSWEQVAARMGRRATGESIKKEYQRFLKKK